MLPVCFTPFTSHSLVSQAPMVIATYLILLGRTRFDRLLLIGQCSVPLCVDALKAAVAEAKRGKDIQRYRDAFECIRVAAPDEPEAKWDEAWVTATGKANKAETHRLETELKGYKNNLVKESIRV